MVDAMRRYRSALKGTAKALAMTREELLRPQRIPVTEEEFDQIIYDAVARDHSMTRESIVAWARKNYEVVR
jgi:hypothetical protein